MLTDLNIKIELEPLLEEISNVQWDSKNRCCLNKTNGNWLFDDYNILPEWKDTAFDKLLSSLPFRVGEARLMKLEPGTCYPCHSDLDDRYHINLTSNDQCYLIDLDTQTMYPVKTDSKIYYMNANIRHTAVNFGDVARIQLVIRKPFDRFDDPNMMKLSVKFVDTQFNFRYEFDQYVSPLIGRMAKNKQLSWFEPKSDTEMIVSTTQDGIHLLLNAFNKHGFKYLTSIEDNK
jgi:hypothetical protein